MAVSAGQRQGLSFSWIPLPVVMTLAFDSFGLSVRSYREPLNEAIRKVMIPAIDHKFDTEGAPEYWQPLQQETIDNRSYWDYDAGPILQRSRKLRKKVTQINLWTVTSDQAFVSEIPADVYYGGIMQEGTMDLEGQGGQIPPRPFLVLEEKDMNDIEEIFFNWVEKKALEKGLVIV